MKQAKKTANKFFIADKHCGFMVYEKHMDGCLRQWHSQVISEEAAKCLYEDLVQFGGAPFFFGPSYIEPSFIAECYDIAVRTLPLIGEGEEAWNSALRVAAEKPWIQTDYCDDPFSEPPF